MIGDTNYGQLSVRYGTASSLSTSNPLLATGEFAVAVDGTTIVLKIGNGVQHWNDLPAIGGGGGGAYIEFTGPTLPTGQPDGTIGYDIAPAV